MRPRDYLLGLFGLYTAYIGGVAVFGMMMMLTGRGEEAVPMWVLYSFVPLALGAVLGLAWIVFWLIRTAVRGEL